MKKPINLIALLLTVILSLGLICGVIFMILHFNDNKATQDIPKTLDTTHFELLHSTTLTEVKKYAEDNKLDYTLSDDGKIGIISSISLVNEEFDVFFYTNDSDSLSRVDASCYITVSEHKELETSLSAIANAVGRFFGLEYEPYYAIYGLDGANLDESVENPVLELFNGKVKFVLSAIDKDGTYWNLTIKKTKDNTYSVEFFHSFEKGVYENGSEIINLTKPKE